jgi:hypothetical protein
MDNLMTPSYLGYTYSDLHYLYTRSFYLTTYPLSDTLKKATKIYVDITKENWISYSLYRKGMAALVLNRFGEAAAAKMIIKSLKETASTNENWGMYWIANKETVGMVPSTYRNSGFTDWKLYRS